jgi:opacity protein-like surface antigen
MTLAGALALLAMPRAQAQRWEFSAGGAASFYTSRSVQGASGDIKAGFKPGGGFTVGVAQAGQKYGGEVRYSFLWNQMQLKGPSSDFTMEGRSHSLEYDFHFYLKDIESKMRPYVIAGGGVRRYEGTGAPTAVQPYMRNVVLTNTNETKPLLTGGIGLRYELSDRWALRTEFRTSFTPVPEQIFTPVPGSTLGGWFFQFLPTVSISYMW